MTKNLNDTRKSALFLILSTAGTLNQQHISKKNIVGRSFPSEKLYDVNIFLAFYRKLFSICLFIFSQEGILHFFVVESQKENITTQALVFRLQSRGLGLDLRSCLVVPVVKKPMQSHHQGQLLLEEELCSLSKPLSLMLCAGSDQHTPFWCAANFLFAIIFPSARDSCISFSVCGYWCTKIQDPLPHFLLLGTVSHKCCKRHSSW